jgi:hypothetical protein
MEDIIKGLLILQKYVGDKGDFSAEHDQVYAGGDGQENMTEEDKKKMEEAGWFFAKETDSWSSFT